MRRLSEIAKGKRHEEKNTEHEEWKMRGRKSSPSQDTYKNAKRIDGKKMVGFVYAAG